MKMITGIELIAGERASHAKRGYDSLHDEKHDDGAMADMAAIYACTHREDEIRDLSIQQLIWSAFPSGRWENSRQLHDWFTEQPDRITELVKAGALIAAEIDRLNGYESPFPVTAKEIDVDAVEAIYDAFANWYHDDGSYDTFLRSEAWKAIQKWQVSEQEEYLKPNKMPVTKELLTVRKFMLKKFPTNKYMDCPVPQHHWETIQEYAEQQTAELKKRERELEAGLRSIKHFNDRENGNYYHQINDTITLLLNRPNGV